MPAEEAEQASPCICTPRELAAQAASFLNMLLDMFGAAEEAGGFQNTAAHRWEGGLEPHTHSGSGRLRGE